MKVRHLIIAILVVSITFIIPQGAYSEAKAFTIKTDKYVYSTGETIHACGTVPAASEDVQVAIQVFNPRDVMYTIAQPMPNTDGTYSFDFKIGGKYGLDGTYTIKATYVGGSTQTTFTFSSTTYDKTGVDFGKPPYEVKTFLTNGNVQDTQINKNHTSIIVLVHTCETEGGELRITLPRFLIDARSNGQDKSFTVLRDGEETKFNETAKDSFYRTLTIAVPAGTEKIEIVGTYVIPEFPIALLILGASVSGLIVMYRTKMYLK